MLLKNTYRKKMLHAILFFATKVKKPSRLKIFKLLYFFDFEHYKETGRSVTNLEYSALDYGPVPLELYRELSDNNMFEDFVNHFVLLSYESEMNEKKGFIVKPKMKPDMSVFSPREKRILNNLAEVYLESDAKLMTDASHELNKPWDKTIKENGINKKIAYNLILEKTGSISPEIANNMEEERGEMIRNFGLKRTVE